MRLESRLHHSFASSSMRHRTACSRTSRLA